MRLFMIAALAAGLALPAIAAGLPENPTPSRCHGEMDGTALTTAIEFADGSMVEAPWRVVGFRQSADRGRVTGRTVSVYLDRIVEIDAAGKRVATPFPTPIETSFRGRDDDEIVHQAAQVWCMTVIKVKEDGGSLVPQVGDRKPLLRSA